VQQETVQVLNKCEKLLIILQVGCSVEVHKPDSSRYLEATLTRITDHSLYTVGMLCDYVSAEFRLAY